MNTKLAQIEKNLKFKARIDSDGKYPIVDGPRNQENEQLIDALYKRNGELQKENSELSGKVKALAIALGKERKKVSVLEPKCCVVCSFRRKDLIL